jgi:cell division protein FtsB
MNAHVSLFGNVPLNQVSKKNLCRIITQNYVRIDQLELENAVLREKNKELSDENIMLRSIIKNNEIEMSKLKQENEILRGRVKTLENKVEKLENEVCTLENKVSAFENEVQTLKNAETYQKALMQLYGYDGLANNKFKDSFGVELDTWNVPNIGTFLKRLPTIKNPDERKFWEGFKKKHPGSDDLRFQEIYDDMNEYRNPIAHPPLKKKITKDDLTGIVKMVFQEKYEMDRELYTKYIDWLMTFINA